MESIIDALVAAGYFRARISGLSDFDKIIGGMAWAMQLFSYDLNIDVFYTDSLDLGQKIGLTERLVMVLLAMHCPYRIEPHQIVGLDYANLVPVVRWLLKRSEEVRREQEAFNRLLALRHYHRVTNTTPDRSSWCHVVPVKYLPSKIGQKGGDGSGRAAALGARQLIEQQETADLIQKINENFKDNQQVSFVQLQSLMRAAGPLEFSSNDHHTGTPLGMDTHDLASTGSDQEDEEEVEEKVDQQLLSQFQLVDEKRTVQDRVIDEKELALHRELDAELLATNQKILNLLKKVDSMPSQLEICQYQRRYIELHQQLISKNKDVKKLYDLYNTLDVTKHYLVKEITLLDSISANLDLTTDSVSNRELFMSQFGEIISKIQQIRHDMQARLDRLRQRCELLNDEYAHLLENMHDLL